MRSEVTMSIIDGTIPQRASDRSRPSAYTWLEATEEEWKSMSTAPKVQYQPSIYGQYLTDEYGVGPTERELAVIIKKLRKYTHFGPENANFARKIDQALNYSDSDAMNWKKGERRYLPKTRFRSQHVQTIKTFCDKVSARLSNPPSNTIRPRPLAEFGYTNHTRKRLDQHSKHICSNRLMNLTESICAVYFPQYSIHQFVLYKIFQHEQGAIAEIIINRIGKGFIESGYGFSHHPAGLNKLSAGVVPAESYTTYTREAYLYTPFKAEHQRQVEIYKELIDKERKEYEDELKELEKEVEAAEAEAVENDALTDSLTDERIAAVLAKIDELEAVITENSERLDKLDLQTNESEGDEGMQEAGGEMDVEEMGGEMEFEETAGEMEAKEAGGEIEFEEMGGEMEVEEAGSEMEVEEAGVEMETGGDEEMAL
ncbi:hypothetical protein IWZ03DRAFT_371546 [Phyllosticta citriasiana]|uniref:Uncharacterized protein n=1 Tax=Phyllosticta citriasiana TaxID=595635 RepID=A0ABR1KQM9_9PEZI